MFFFLLLLCYSLSGQERSFESCELPEDGKAIVCPTFSAKQKNHSDGLCKASVMQMIETVKLDVLRGLACMRFGQNPRCRPSDHLKNSFK